MSNYPMMNILGNYLVIKTAWATNALDRVSDTFEFLNRPLRPAAYKVPRAAARGMISRETWADVLINRGGAMDRKDVEEYYFKKREIDLLSAPDPGLDERIEGLRTIKDIISPRMSMTTFYRRHRPHLDYILFIDQDAWRHNTPKFFTYRRLIYHYMLKRRRI